MSETLFYIVLIGLGLLYLIIGLIASRGVKDNQDYFLMGREMGFYSLTLTLLATQIGGGALLGTANESYVSGLKGISYNLGMCLGFLILGLKFAGKWRQFNVSTVPELFEIYYKDSFLRKLASILSMLSLFGLLIAQVVASKSLLIGIDLYNPTILLLLWAFIIFYTVMGGLKAVVYTDVVQILIILVVFIVAFFISIIHSLKNGLPAPPFFDYMSGVDTNSQFLFEDKSADGGNGLSFWALFIFPLMFSLVEQDLAQRFFAAKSAAMAKKAAILTAIIILFFSIIPVHLGMKAKLMGLLPSHEGGSALVIMLKAILSPTLLTFAICSLLAAIISTADSLLCAVSSHLCLDFKLLSKHKTNDKNISRIVTLIVGLVSVILGFYFDNILKVIVQSYQLLVTALFASIFIAFYKKKLNTISALFSVIAGTSSYIGFLFVKDFGIPRELVAIIFSFAFYFLGELMASKVKFRRGNR